MKEREIVQIFDTTLRDGEQSPGATMNAQEKLKVALQLARLGVDAIEAGFPISSPGDFEAVRAIARSVEGPIIAGLARSEEKDVRRAGEAVKDAARRRIHTFIATSPIHMKAKLRKTPRQVIRAAVDNVRLAREYTDDVEFSAEDATRSEPDFLIEIFEKVIDAGATVINIPDTVGYTTPSEYGPFLKKIIKGTRNAARAVFSVHCHNDLGLAVANSLTAVQNGVRQVECTVNGLGERAGNAAMEEIVMALKTRRDVYGVDTNVNTREIYRASRLVSHITGFEVQRNKAIVGRNAFAHEAGIHQHGVLMDARTYEIMNARDIGLAKSDLVLGKHSGRHAFTNRLREMGVDLTQVDAGRLFERFKELADRKKEVSEWDIESLVDVSMLNFSETYKLESINVMSAGSGKSTAMIAMRRGERLIEEAAIGVGPVDALFQCIRKITGFKGSLEDFSVKSVTGGLDALGEVSVKLRDECGRSAGGLGARLDILEAAARAYIMAINKLVSSNGHDGAPAKAGRKKSAAKSVKPASAKPEKERKSR